MFGLLIGSLILLAICCVFTEKAKSKKNKEQGEQSSQEVKDFSQKFENQKNEKPFKVFVPNDYELENGGLGFERQFIKHIEISYEDYYGNCSSRKLEIYEAFQKGENWFINAYCYSACDDRTFKVNRIQSMKILKTQRTMYDQSEMVRYLKGVNSRNYS